MSERKKWFAQVGLCVALWLVMVGLLILSSASFIMTAIIGTILMGFIIFFSFYALRNYFIFPYHAAAARIRSMISGDLDIVKNTTSIKEAQDLFATINDLSSELKAKSKMIEKLERMRIDFVANVSHELKTPLTSIKGYTETLKAGAASDPKVRDKFLDRIEDNANRLIAIIGDLLVLSHIESFPQDIAWESFDSAQLAKKLDGTFMPNLEKRKQRLEISFEDSKIEGDLKKLEHVFTNLVDNANRYCPEGAIIKINQTKDDFHWIYLVSDNGPGIPPQNQPRIFERFYRVDSDRNRDTGGTGLGLSIVKHMVLLHDGAIKLESEVGNGTRFFIRLPRRML